MEHSHNVIAAIVLEAMYQQLRERGQRRTRRAFFKWAQSVVEAMIERGDLVPVHGA